MHNRYDVGLEQYALSVCVQATLTLEIGATVVLPAAVRYKSELAVNLGALKAAGLSGDVTSLDSASGPLTHLWTAVAWLGAALADDAGSTAMAEAEHALDALLPAMAAVWGPSDQLEKVVADDLWPFAT